MLRHFPFGLLLLVLPFSLAQAQNGPPAKADSKTNAAHALFHDGTKVRMVILQDNLEVATRFGKLTVPTADIRRIEFGFRLPEETGRKLDEAIKNLGSTNFPLREAAQKELVGLGRQAYPTLVKFARGSDLETTRRVEDILKAIREKVPAEQLRSRTDDLVYTPDFVIVGHIETPTFKARTEHFGEVQLKVADLRSVLSASGIGEAKATVDAATYGSNTNQWMDTGFLVSADVPLSVTASGEVDLYGNQQPGQYISGPEGNRNVGRQGVHIPGMLLGRIGEDGPTFIVGKKYDATPNVEGKLYVRIVPIPGSGGATGSYSVKIAAGTAVAQ